MFGGDLSGFRSQAVNTKSDILQHFTAAQFKQREDEDAGTAALKVGQVGGGCTITTTSVCTMEEGASPQFVS